MIRPAPNFQAAFMLSILLSLLLLSGCKPSNMLKPDNASNGPEKQAESPKPQKTNPPAQAGIWQDGKGNTWEITKDGSTLSGVATRGPSMGLRMSARKTRTAHTLKIGTDDQSDLGVGTLQFLGDAHAYFNFDGAMSAHGLFHINHANDAESCTQTGSRKPPTDLRPPKQEEG